MVWSKRVGKRTLLLGFGIAGAILFVLSVGIGFLFSILPSQNELRGCLTGTFNNVRICPGSGNYVKLKEISPYLRKAVLAAEDSAFYNHHGFDFREIQNSVEANLKRGGYARGGSTISQQLAKNLFLSKEKSLNRKLREALITLRIEKYLSKNEILERYLNIVQFDKEIFGIKAAARHYFGKHPRDLNLTESTFLAFLLPNPKAYSKSFYQKSLTSYARKRIGALLDDMFQYDYVDVLDYTEAKRSYIHLFGPQPELIQDSPGEETRDDQVDEATEVEPDE